MTIAKNAVSKRTFELQHLRNSYSLIKTLDKENFNFLLQNILSAMIQK